MLNIAEGQLNTLTAEYKDVNLLVMDEISMVGQRLWAAADCRSRSFWHKPNQSFGGKDCIVFGDFYQLKAVQDSCIFKYASTGHKGMAFKTWREFRMLNLVEAMRQNEPEWIATLNRCRVGVPTDSDIKIINARVAPSWPPARDVPLVALAREDVKIHNDKVLRDNTGTGISLHAVDRLCATCPRDIIIPSDAKHTGGLWAQSR